MFYYVAIKCTACRFIAWDRQPCPTEAIARRRAREFTDNAYFARKPLVCPSCKNDAVYIAGDRTQAPIVAHTR
jgi:hypothetical protein